MKNLFLKTSLLLLISVLLWNCKQDELDMSKFSNNNKVERTMALPLFYGDISLSKIITNDSVLIIKGDSSLTDTLEFSVSDDGMSSFELEYFDLHHSTKNYLPIGVNLSIIIYDSVSALNLDTIRFTDDALYLEPAELDESGNIIESSVDSVAGIISIDNQLAENILNVATHLIFEIKMLSDTTRIIPVNELNRVWVKYGVHFKGTYYTN